MSGEVPFDALDFLYMPSADVERDLRFYTEVLGGEAIFAIEAFGTRVAQVRMSPGTRLLLAGHLEGAAPILVYRVADLDASLAQLAGRGLQIGERFGIPHGPCAELHAPGGQRIALYELRRPQVEEHFAGRFDFGTGMAPPAAGEDQGADISSGPS